MKALTVDQISTDRLTYLGQQYWSPETKESHSPYDPQVIEDIYETEVKLTDFNIKRIVVLELSQYLENYVWPNYSENASRAHVMSVVVLINEKFRERVPAWSSFEKHCEPFPVFLHHLMNACLDNEDKFTLKEQTCMVIFLNHLYNSIESDLIRNGISHTVSYNILECLSEGQLEHVLRDFPNWAKALKRTARHRKKLQGEELEKFTFDTKFLFNLMQQFLKRLMSVPKKDEGDVEEDLVHYCERFLELMIDLESQLPTRRFFNTLFHSCTLIVKCELSPLAERDEGKLFMQLLHILKIYAQFEINDNTGQPLTDMDVMKYHYDQVRCLQKIAFQKFPQLRQLTFSNIASIDTEQSLKKHLSQLDDEDLHTLIKLLHLVAEGDTSCDRGFLMSLIVWKYQKRPSQMEAINRMPLYPTETIIWDDNIVPSEYFSGDACLALPKLNLQFLTLHDYLLRNFDLFRLESTYEIRQDIEDVVMRLNPWEAEDNSILFRGWARMAQPIVRFAVCEVAKPNVGEDKPSRVRADITVTLSVRRDIKSEWEALRKHDVCLLISICHPKQYPNLDGYFPEEFGVKYVRGCEIEGMLDENGRVIEDGPEPKPEIKGDVRTFRVWLDCNQYKIDMDEMKNRQGNEDVYETFNILMRRKPKENNFKAVLETIRDLMTTRSVVPDWLLDIILGYGDPGAAHYSKRDTVLSTLDFNDTFLDFEHLKESFPGYTIDYDPKTELIPPFRLTFDEQNSTKRENDTDEGKTSKIISVSSYVIPSRGPYPYTVPRKNTVRFTPTQIEAIRSGMQPGLTMVVGPPGTGKTDVAVQIISNIYHNNPRERTLVVTHSNQALNQLFEKIMALDVDERHLLRLGHGEEALETEKDFSRYGRVNYVLGKRMELLEEVTRLKESLGVAGEMGASCETAGYFFLQHILARWERYISKVRAVPGKAVNVEDVNSLFPFHVFFSNAPQPLFKGESYEEDMEIALGCYRYIENIFTQLKEFRAFEMLRSGLDRTRYLLVKEAKIIAMTCTHAALKRRELVELGFQFDNILMEESAQILEIETFIPLLLQNPEDGRNRLKRWIMIGDHHQLPPVIKNMAFQKFSNMEQSLFTRFVRIGVPTIELDAQGRARPSICALYNWRYRNLGNLPHVTAWPEFRVGNGGFFHDYQLINVEDLQGKGETEPRKYFYQNLGEAEYMVHLYMYMRLLGYPADKISLLTTYNGQKELLRDVVEQRCARNPLFGRPHKISTVDKYQGQQNDYILLSLVRTKAVGHLRDVRRLVVAMSRARLGLYIFARTSLFKNCYELQPAFALLTKRPMKLHVAPTERYGCTRPMGTLPEGKPRVVQDVTDMSVLVHEMYGDMCAAYQQLFSTSKDSAAPGNLSIQEPADTGARYDSDEDTKEKGDEGMIVNEIETPGPS
ncbi:RNA helicase aquarius [Oratosquilla oratoria]|uniref:RNA helicase aquarius n=1 Tax=Oratosquilla oratoria TaxID=337810 RepID=UPI003F774266